VGGVCNLGLFGGDCDALVCHLVAPNGSGGLWLIVVSEIGRPWSVVYFRSQ
jgi:hypothetical protein